jgi:hypothetical protein
MFLYYASDWLHALYEVCPNSFETFIVECVFHLGGNCTYHLQSTPLPLFLPIFEAVLECLFQYHLQVCKFPFFSSLVIIFTLSMWISAWGTGNLLQVLDPASRVVVE